MNERMKVLELLQDGKITAEQAAELLAAIDDNKAGSEKSGREFPFNWTFPRKSGEELKAMTAQIKTTVQQHLDEFRKNIDREDWSFRSVPRVAATIEQALPPTTTHIAVETRNGRIRASRWDGDHVRIQVRSYVKAESADEAKRALEATLGAVEVGDRFELSIQPTRETGEANVEIYVPQGSTYLKLLSHNGSIRADDLRVAEVAADAHNGNIVVYQVHAERLRLLTHNGSVDIQHSVVPGCQSVYATTHNGTIDLDGIAPGARISGTAKSQHGRIEITGERLTAEYHHPQQRQHARFFSSATSDASAETQVFCETHNGMVIVRA